MRALLTVMFHRGKPINKRLKQVEVSISTVPGRFPGTGAPVLMSTAFDHSGSQPMFGPMYRTELLWICKDGFQIRGTEILNNGQHVTQEWYIVPLREKQDEKKG